MTYTPELLEAVAVLDVDSPGWHRKIDLGHFNLFSDNCVVGQVYGARGIGQIMDKITELGANALTFCGRSVPTNCPNTLAWQALIAERQEADRIGETLSIPELDEVEGYERVTA